MIVFLKFLQYKKLSYILNVDIGLSGYPGLGNQEIRVSGTRESGDRVIRDWGIEK